jgi:type II secretory pathway predicted ATPase ExeA
VLLIDEAQEMSPPLLSELRLLGSTKLDTCTIVTVVLCGDRRLEEKLRTPDLLPIASRIRTRLVLDVEAPDVLGTMLRHVLTAAGNASLMTDELQHTVCEHAAGNRRVLMNLCNELLALAVAKNAKRLDESLYLDMTNADHRPSRPSGTPTKAKPARR